MKTIYLRRQGCGRSLNSNNRSDLDFHIAIHAWQQTDQYIAQVSYSNDLNKWGDKRGQTAFSIGKHNELYDLVTIKRLVEKGVYENFGEQIHISNVTERYGYEWKSLTGNCEGDIYFTCCIYDSDTDVIQLVPESHILISFEGTQYDIITNAVTEKYLPVLQECAKLYEKELLLSCNKDKPESYFKGWLTWLISERLKEQFPLSVSVHQHKSLIKKGGEING